MSPRELRKLDGRSPGHADRRQGASPHSPPVGMLAEAPAPFRPFPSGGADQAPDTLFRYHANGQITARQLYDRLALWAGAPRVHLSLTPPDPALSARLPVDLCLKLSCLPWKTMGDDIRVATDRPDRFAAARPLLAKHLDHPAAQIRPVTCSRDEVQDHLARTHRTNLIQRMRSRVPLALSCRSWRARSPLRLAAALAALILFASLALTWPAPLMTALITLALINMGIASLMRSGAAIARLTSPDPPPQMVPDQAKSRLPTIAILVPLFREDRIASALIKRLQHLEYPRENLDILLILEETDTLTRDAVAQTDLPPWIRAIIVPDGEPRTKPRAMNYALDFCDGEIIGIYDAEDAPDPDQLIRVAKGFATAPPDVVCLQGALDYYNPRASWIARCFTIEYNTWFRLILPGMARLGFALPLGGTTLFFKRPQLEEIGAWDAHNVTEDADLGFRLARAGYRTQTIPSTTKEEANHRALPWIRQRSRWLKGYLATYLVHMRRPLRLWRDLGTWQFLGFQAHFITALMQFTLSPLLWLFWMVSLGIDLPFTQIDSDPMVKTLARAFLAHELLTMILGIIATRRAGHKNLWLWVPLMHLYWPLAALAMWKALYELLFKPFYWDKTDHGHSLADPAIADHIASDPALADSTDFTGIQLEPGDKGARDVIPQLVPRRDFVARLDRGDDGVMF